MRSLLAVDGRVLSGVLDGLDEGDPEWVFFHDLVDVYGGGDQGSSIGSPDQSP
jgi:hypothetical protein